LAFSISSIGRTCVVVSISDYAMQWTCVARPNIYRKKC
jgi:hypothetical protein